MGNGAAEVQADVETKREIYLDVPLTTSPRLKLVERGRTYSLRVTSGAGYVQVGCTRITRSAWERIVKLAG